MRLSNIYNSLLNEVYDIKNIDRQRDTKKIYFDVADYNYEVSLIPFQADNRFYSFGFKAKRNGESYYDFDMLTNENVYKVMQTISLILENFYNQKISEIKEALKHFNVSEDKAYVMFKGFVFSLHSKDQKKNNQRLLLYKRYVSKYDFIVGHNENNNLYFIAKK